MKKKKFSFKSVFDRSTIITLLICVILISLISGGSLASRNTKGITDNVISSDQIKVKLINRTSAGDDMPEMLYAILPSEKIDNVVEVKNTCDQDEYVRVRFKLVITDEDGSELSTEHFTFRVNENDWTYKDGFYYYNKILPAGGTSDYLYDLITVGSEIDNSYAKATARVDILTDAVQVVNNGVSPLDAEGWEEPS